jgi:hypothetical protein
VELKDLGYAHAVKGAGGWMDGNLVTKVSMTSCLLATGETKATNFCYLAIPIILAPDGIGRPCSFFFFKEMENIACSLSDEKIKCET